MPKPAKYLVGFVVAVYVLRNPNAAADTVSSVLNALLSVLDKATAPKA